jgi:hypothetical protein
MARLPLLLKPFLFCLAAPLAAQMPPFVDGPAFGGTRIFSDGLIPNGSAAQNPNMPSFWAFGYAKGDQGAGKFLSSLDDLSSDAIEKINNAILELGDSPWGLRSRAYGLALYDRETTFSLTREEMTSLWASVPDSALDTGTVGFDIRRSVVERATLTSYGSSKSGKAIYGGTLRVERWSLGGEYQMLGIFSPDADLSNAAALLDYRETSGNSITYAMDAFAILEIADGVRLAVQTNRVASRDLGDLKENPQFRAGAQIDLGSAVQLTLESDINEAMRMPFPVMQKTAAASLKVKANETIAFAVGAEKKTMDGQHTIRFGLNAWIKLGKQNQLGAGFQIGQDRTPWGATWKTN